MPPSPCVPGLLEPDLLDPFNASLAGAGFALLTPEGSPALPRPLPCGGTGGACLSGPSCPHGWTVRRAPIPVSAGLAGHLVGQRAPQCQAPELEALLGQLRAQAQARFELESTVGELVETYELLSVLYDSAEAIVTISNLDEVSQRILDEAAQTLQVDHAWLMLLEEGTQELRLAAARGEQGEAARKARVPVGEGLSGQVAREGKPLLVEDLSSHPLAGLITPGHVRPGSLLSVPLKVKDRVLGVINLQNKRNGEPFRAGDLKLLSALADLAALSIENALTYQNAITDRLTRLYNYGYFREQLESALGRARESGAPLSLLMFDIDHFKNFNDVHGHEVANAVLVRLAALCRENTRQTLDRPPDLVARYGGEEFVILLPATGKEDAFRKGEAIRKLIESEPFEGGERQPGGRVTVSMGVACFPEDAPSSEALINRADQALYRAKRSGRNHVQLA